MFGGAVASTRETSSVPACLPVWVWLTAGLCLRLFRHGAARGKNVREGAVASAA